MPEKMKVTKKAVWVEICCFLLVVLFLYASISKLVDLQKFTDQMHNQPFPLWFSSQLVWFVPGVEIVVSLFIISPLLGDGKVRTVGLYGSLVLMALFGLYTALVLLRVFGRVPCSCGGVIEGLNWWQHLVFNLFFVFVSWAALRLRRQPKQAKPLTDVQNVVISTA